MINQHDLQVKRNRLLSGSNILIEADEAIINYLALKNVIVILTSGEHTDQNIVAYDSKGNFKWRVTKPDELHERNYYTSIYLAHNSQLQGYNSNGVEVTINIKDGTILKKELVK